MVQKFTVSHRANIGTLRKANPRQPQWIERANKPMVAMVRKGWAQIARKIFFITYLFLISVAKVSRKIEISKRLSKNPCINLFYPTDKKK